ncbi:tRNA (adenine-N(6)-)-methyltransferase [Nonlabens arenilitoris]|uniref:tRNA1(Val) (adenine(37)-N6)-methyltransferase n=1 Tax=Nonlabens arenilitoris TaxID=1217969 RepID=A0A2S7U870_9FLAO|nr:methyltransferase [Nonlabens arenilitoris]PQJ31166.1 tRNA (adenine-N(6)-)-methyltransferase [Nonlabens arenilitoris]
MSVFKFKEFEVAQDRCAQKIGTDGVLLGAWASKYKTPYNILDIGTGTGVIALMLAQRFHNAQIEAIELDEDAFEQAATNFENAQWSDRMFCYHASFQEFFEEVDDTYDLIISNPPFFDSASINNNATIEKNREQARFDQALPFEELLYGVYKLLDDDGIFSCIIPYERETHFLKIAAHYKLFPSRITHVKGTDSSAIKRSLLELRFCESEIKPDLLTIEISRHQYTKDYTNLVRDFYLKM